LRFIFTLILLHCHALRVLCCRHARYGLLISRHKHACLYEARLIRHAISAQYWPRIFSPLHGFDAPIRLRAAFADMLCCLLFRCFYIDAYVYAFFHVSLFHDTRFIFAAAPFSRHERS